MMVDLWWENHGGEMTVGEPRWENHGGGTTVGE